MIRSRYDNIGFARRDSGHASLSGWPAESPDAAVVVIDLSGRPNVTTAGFASLVLLRRRLLSAGRDLRVTGLRGRARSVYDVSRLGDVLPEAVG